ncbi:MAG: flagellar basal body P-ring formation chaperone FlgA [candidate division Zixibacteria bacterium]
MRRTALIAVICLMIMPAVLMAENSKEDIQYLETYLAEKIVSDYELNSDDVEIRLIRCAARLDDLSSCDIQAYPLTQSNPRGRFPMRVEIYRDDAMTGKGSVTLEVRIFADLPVPIRRISRNDILTPQMFSLKRFDVTSIREKMLTDLSQMENIRARQNLSEGRYVSLNKIEKIPDVENGMPVSIIASSGIFEIRAKGMALQRGYIGESIKVKNIDSKKIIMGKITSPGVVEITL